MKRMFGRGGAAEEVAGRARPATKGSSSRKEHTNDMTGKTGRWFSSWRSGGIARPVIDLLMPQGENDHYLFPAGGGADSTRSSTSAHSFRPARINRISAPYTTNPAPSFRTNSRSRAVVTGHP